MEFINCIKIQEAIGLHLAPFPILQVSEKAPYVGSIYKKPHPDYEYVVEELIDRDLIILRWSKTNEQNT